MSKPFTRSIIEGFYGRQWSWAQRFALPELLAQWQYASYIYAPKGDASLRNNWAQPFTTSHLANLENLARHCHAAGLKWGLGLSPVGLQAEYDVDQQLLLKNKIKEIQSLKPDILWVLFDDLPAGNQYLARNQIAVVNDIQRSMPGVELAMCPSYYSFDPILEELFGACPENYFKDLNAGLPQEIELLWTGNRVISNDYSAEDCRRATEVLGRKPLIWDNYPVNDGRKTSRFLHLAAFDGRPYEMAQWCSGHAINPMNQFHLSLLVLPTLAEVYTREAGYDPIAAFNNVLEGLPWPLSELLRRDAGLFQYSGLDAMNLEQKQNLIKTYSEIQHPVADEICAWLQEEYRFDPACLTD